MKKDKILVARLCCIGDIVHSIPMIKTIKKNNPNAEITYLVTNWCRQIVEMAPEVDKFIIFDAPYQKISVLSKMYFAFLLWLKIISGRYSIGINLHRSAFFGIIFFFAGIKKRIGFGDSPFLNHKIKYDDSFHESKKFLALLSPLDYKQIVELPSITADEKTIESAKNILSRNGITKDDLLVGIYADGGRNPGQVMEIRQLGSEKYVEFIQSASKKYDKIKFLLINSKEGKGNAEEINNRFGGDRVVLLSSLSLKEVAAISSLCKVFIGGDTGILHLASATGTPVLMFYGPDDPKQWAPLGVGHKIIFHKIECSPCYTPVTVKDKSNFKGNVFICKRGDALCMSGITVDEIMTAFDEIMETQI